MAKTEHGVDVEKVPVWYLEKAINGMMPGLQMFVRDVVWARYWQINTCLA